MAELISWEELRNLRKLKRFPVVVSCTFDEREVLSHIYPLMQRSVLSILQCRELYGINIFVFGSSLSIKCNIASDLDLAIETPELNYDMFYGVQNRIANLLDVPCDIIYLNDIKPEEPIYSEIRKGFLVRRGW